jgi:hypothetical protein
MDDVMVEGQKRGVPMIAVIGLLLGIVGLFFLPLPFGLLALILGIASHVREKASLAWLAVILGIANIIFWAIAVTQMF